MSFRTQLRVLAALAMCSPLCAQQPDEGGAIPPPIILTSPLPSGAVGLPVPPPQPQPNGPQGFGVYTGGTPNPDLQFVNPPVQVPQSSSSAAALTSAPEPASLERLRQTIDSLEIQVKALRDMLVRGAPREPQTGLSSINAFLRGRQFAERRLHRAAIDAFSDAILLDPANDSAYLLRAESYQQLADLPNAEADFNESLRLQPNNSRAYLGRAAVRSALGKTQEALADVAQAVTRDPNNIQAYLLRARLRDATGDPNAAADYSAALTIAPNLEALLGRATFYLRNGQFALASNDCEAARRINPNAPLAHLCLAEVHIRQNSIADAVSALNRAMQAAQATGQTLPLLPQLPAVLAQSIAPATPALVAAPPPAAPPAPVAPPVVVAVAQPKPEPPKPVAPKPAPPNKINAAEYDRQARDLTNQGRYEEALDLLNQALAQSPKFAQALNARGFVHLLMLNYTSAVADFTEAIRLKPDYANAYHNRSVALRKLSKTSDAEADEKNASRLMAVVYPLQ